MDGKSRARSREEAGKAGRPYFAHNSEIELVVTLHYRQSALSTKCAEIFFFGGVLADHFHPDDWVRWSWR
jgi:hypothetical protein